MYTWYVLKTGWDLSSGIHCDIYDVHDTKTQERDRENSVCYSVWESHLIKSTTRSNTKLLMRIMFV